MWTAFTLDLMDGVIVRTNPINYDSYSTNINKLRSKGKTKTTK